MGIPGSVCLYLSAHYLKTGRTKQNRRRRRRPPSSSLRPRGGTRPSSSGTAAAAGDRTREDCGGGGKFKEVHGVLQRVPPPPPSTSLTRCCRSLARSVCPSPCVCVCVSVHAVCFMRDGSKVRKLKFFEYSTHCFVTFMYIPLKLIQGVQSQI